MKSVDKAYSLCEKDKAKLHAYADPYIRRLQGALAMPTKFKKQELQLEILNKPIDIIEVSRLLEDEIFEYWIEPK
ncbi:hypothetical protein IDM30_07170 [Acinetobacter seifertii]|nr:hypothetical protein [Acinetobacter seifertii]